MLYFFALILLIPILAIFLDSDLGKALARRLDGRAKARGGDLTEKRLEYLEGEVDRLNTDLDTLRGQNEFLQKLLEAGPESTSRDR